MKKLGLITLTWLNFKNLMRRGEATCGREICKTNCYFMDECICSNSIKTYVGIISKSRERWRRKEGRDGGKFIEEISTAKCQTQNMPKYQGLLKLDYELYYIQDLFVCWYKTSLYKIF